MDFRRGSAGRWLAPSVLRSCCCFSPSACVAPPAVHRAVVFHTPDPAFHAPAVTVQLQWCPVIGVRRLHFRGDRKRDRVGGWGPAESCNKMRGTDGATLQQGTHPHAPLPWGLALIAQGQSEEHNTRQRGFLPKTTLQEYACPSPTRTSEYFASGKSRKKHTRRFELSGGTNLCRIYRVPGNNPHRGGGGGATPRVWTPTTSPHQPLAGGPLGGLAGRVLGGAVGGGGVGRGFCLGVGGSTHLRTVGYAAQV